MSGASKGVGVYPEGSARRDVRNSERSERIRIETIARGKIWILGIALIAALLLPAIAHAQYQPIPNYGGVGAGQQFRNDVNNHLSGGVPIAPRLVSIPFSVLTTIPENDGQLFWCRDCAQAAVCTGGGSGAVALGAGGQWTCTVGPMALSGPPSGAAGGDLLGSNYPNPTVHTVLGGKTPVTTTNGINFLAQATGNYSMGGNKFTTLGVDSATADVLSRNQSTLNSLASPTATYNMNSQTLGSVAPASVSGQPLVGGVNNTVGNTQLAATRIAANGATFDTTLSRPALTGINIGGRIDASAYGAVGDMVAGTDGVTTSSSSSFSTASRNCSTSTDIGKVLVINGANGYPAGTTVTGCSGNSYTLSNSATAGASSQNWYLGTNNASALLAAAQAACPAPGPTCRSALYLPGAPAGGGPNSNLTGRYLVSYTGSASALVWNPSTLGNGSQVFAGGFHLIGDGGRENTQGGGPAATEILIAANSAKLGIDMFATAYVVIENIDIEEPVGATGPTYLLGGGKTTSCDCDVVSLINDSFTTYTGQSSGGVFAYGWENFSRINTDIKALGGGHALVWSGSNALNSITASGVTLRTPPVSNTEYTETGESGGFTQGTAGKPAACFYLDGATPLNIHRLGYFCNMYGPTDYDMWDGNTAAVGGVAYDFTVHGRIEDNANGANTQQAIKLGAKLDDSDINITFSAATPPSTYVIQDYTAITDSLVHVATGFAGSCITTPQNLSSILLATNTCTISIPTFQGGITGNDGGALSIGSQGLSLLNGGFLSLASSTFAALPACSTSNELWCSDCKDVAAGVTMASTCVAGGSGSVAVCKGGSWKCGQ